MGIFGGASAVGGGRRVDGVRNTEPPQRAEQIRHSQKTAKRSALLRRELAQSASQNHFNSPWHKQITIHDREQTPRQTRRGRAPIAVLDTKVVMRSGKARRRTRHARPAGRPGPALPQISERLGWEGPRRSHIPKRKTKTLENRNQ